MDGFSSRCAHLLRKAGLAKGDRVLMAMENSIESAAFYYGVLKAGGVCVEIHDRSTPDETAYFVRDSGARILVLSKAAARRLGDVDIPTLVSPEALPERSSRTVFRWDEMDTMSDDPPKISLDEQDLAAIVYTSGSTGHPKGVMLTHGNLHANTESIVASLGLVETDRVMSVLPFYYVYGKTLLNTHVCVGGSVVIDNRFAFPSAVVKAMVEKEITGFSGVPSSFAMLLNRSTFPNTHIPTLRYVTQAGGAMAPSLTRRLLDHLGAVPLFVMYGATEAAARLTYLPPDRLRRDKLGSIGIPIPGVEVTVRDDEGKELAAGEVGNLCATGPNIMRGYWQDPEETDRALKPWGLVTGDIGYRDEEGYLFLTARKKEMLKVGGERVSPKEIEDAILASGMVHEAAVVGAPDDLLYEVPAAFVVPIDEASFHQPSLQSHVAQRLAGHKHPRFWHVRTSLPKKPSGKIDKKALTHASHQGCCPSRPGS
jgi:acyl-CoA synthetase (AMP-forming)/AMP-acid ligase II